MRIQNEFAAVEIELDTTANDPRLRVTDTSTGMEICLDAFELQSLAWARHEDLARFADPLFKEDMLERITGSAQRREAEEIVRASGNQEEPH